MAQIELNGSGKLDDNPRVLRLDDIYMMVAAIYSERNAERHPSVTFSHFVEVCGALSVYDRGKTRDQISRIDAICKALAWYFPLLAKFGISSVERLVFRKFPDACPYCLKKPHDDLVCKTIKGTAATLRKKEVMEKFERDFPKRPSTLDEWMGMFYQIYPRNTTDYARNTLGLFEEIGELGEAIRVYEEYPKFFAGEAADVFSYLMGFANQIRMDELKADREFSLEAEFLARYPGLCTQCGHSICVCPFVPEATVGRMAKEADIPANDQLFGLDIHVAVQKGREIGNSVWGRLQGIPGSVENFPFDRGEANRALERLCLIAADSLDSKNKKLAAELRAAAIKAGNSPSNPGTRGQSAEAMEVVNQLKDLWPSISFAFQKSDKPLLETVGKMIAAESIWLGIVTALPEEYAAVKTLLENVSPFPVSADPNDYVVGTIPAKDGSGAHTVALTLLKTPGNSSAAATATHLIRSFPFVKEVMMVGIAGGIPRPDRVDKHVRLGDVVVSPGEGVLQYDKMKYEGGEIEIRGTGNKPSALMAGKIRMLDADGLTGSRPWEDYIRKCSEKVTGATRPSTETDKLYDWSEPPQLVPHPADSNRQADQPKIFLGKIASSNILLRDPAMRNYLRDKYDINAVEMEGSGIADGAWISGRNYLLIRGISDYADQKKNDVWHGYAAAAAAAYMRSLIESISIRDIPPSQ